ncbi:MAG: hypothetical protein VX777_05735 [Chlamydiota bacterium]|nr:hypothetical protein [Chlamydiota bacterium]
MPIIHLHATFTAMKNLRLFQKFVVLIFLFFLGIIIFVVAYANSRKSGVTGLNMSRIQEMRIEAEKNQNRDPR